MRRRLGPDLQPASMYEMERGGALEQFSCFSSEWHKLVEFKDCGSEPLHPPMRMLQSWAVARRRPAPATCWAR